MTYSEDMSLLYDIHLHTIYCHIVLYVRRAKLGQIQGGVAEGHPRFNKGGVAIISLFRVKIRTF